MRGCVLFTCLLISPFRFSCLVPFPAAITSVDFGKHQSISGLLKDFKQGVYTEFPSDVLAHAQSSGPVHSTMRRFFESLFLKYNKSQLLTVSRKVEEVKEVMKDNVNKALNNVEQLEEMEVKAESMENQAKLFERRSGSVLWLMRSHTHTHTTNNDQTQCGRMSTDSDANIHHLIGIVHDSGVDISRSL